MTHLCVGFVVGVRLCEKKGLNDIGTIIRKSLGIHLFFICKQISPMNINLKASVSSLSLFCLFLRKAQNTLSRYRCFTWPP